MSGMFFYMSKEEVQAEYKGIIAKIRSHLAEMDEAMAKQDNCKLMPVVFPLSMEVEKLSALVRFAPLPFEYVSNAEEE